MAHKGGELAEMKQGFIILTYKHIRKATISVMITLCAMAFIAPVTAAQAQPFATIQFKKMTTMIGEWKTQEPPSIAHNIRADRRRQRYP